MLRFMGLPHSNDTLHLAMGMVNEGRNERLSLQERALPLGLAVIERAALFPGCGLGQYRRTIGDISWPTH